MRCALGVVLGVALMGGGETLALSCRNFVQTFIPLSVRFEDPTNPIELAKQWRMSRQAKASWGLDDELRLIASIDPDLRGPIQKMLQRRVFLRWPVGISWHARARDGEMLYRRLAWLTHQVLIYTRSPWQRHGLDSLLPRHYAVAYRHRYQQLDQSLTKILSFLKDQELVSHDFEPNLPRRWAHSDRGAVFLGLLRSSAIALTVTLAGLDLHSSLTAAEQVKHIQNEITQSERRSQKLRVINQQTSTALDKLKQK